MILKGVEWGNVSFLQGTTLFDYVVFACFEVNQEDMTYEDLAYE